MLYRLTEHIITQVVAKRWFRLQCHLYVHLQTGAKERESGFPPLVLLATIELIEFCIFPHAIFQTFKQLWYVVASVIAFFKLYKINFSYPK